ncbi:hypothetical protein L2E82_27665 [Cichorium intybus]|uniref:Uncharacterized protein n=1 Tax=Cichorium intybus TaxID=13427 RepID=A0ACB9CTR5_CICIN|nr:hypothetical protein L2E82_27665 [Cichorium intybus]
MAQNVPVTVKKVWSLVRAMFFMLKKGISKRKFFLNLNMMMKRGKIAGKTFNNLMFHDTTKPPGEYEFSCSNTPPYPLSLFSTHKKHQNKCHRFDTPKKPHTVDDSDDIIIDDAVFKVLNMLSDTASPLLPGSGNTPMVTDSPFPLTHCDEDGHVDEAAEKFIRRFYCDRRREN